MTLDLLLSFAQFEREVIGERICDKVAGSKRKGMWLGVTTSKDCDLRDRKPAVNRDEGNIVRKIYERYLEFGSAQQLKLGLDERGIVSAIKVARKNPAVASHYRAARFTVCLPILFTLGEFAVKVLSIPGSMSPLSVTSCEITFKRAARPGGRAQAAKRKRGRARVRRG